MFKAVGQTLTDDDPDTTLKTTAGKIKVDGDGRTSVDGVWAGGDCAFGRDDLTVSAVQDGKLAAISIDRWLREGS